MLKTAFEKSQKDYDYLKKLYADLESRYQQLGSYCDELKKTTNELESKNVTLSRKNIMMSNENTSLLSMIQGNSVEMNKAFVEDLMKLFGINDRYALMQTIKKMKGV